MNIGLSILHQNSQQIAFNQLLKKHKQTIIYFYPKDDTPGCTIEAKDFSVNYGVFMEHDIGIYGISKDSDVSHCNFITRYSLSIPLISDPQLILHKKYNAYGEKNIYGKKVLGTIRSTFLLDKNGNILQARKNVQAVNHVQNIMMTLGLK